jgi:murein DD-endopeptidase MepM/ murein hydrolase activator NlpD
MPSEILMPFLPTPAPQRRRGSAAAAAIVAGVLLLLAFATPGLGAGVDVDPPASDGAPSSPSTAPSGVPSSAGPTSSADASPSAVPSASPPPSPSPTGPWVVPVRKPRITTPFGPYSGGNTLNPKGRPSHDGVDLATFCGDKVVAAHAGTVIGTNRHYAHRVGYSTRVADYLDLVFRKRPMWLPVTIVIDHGGGLRTVYAHMQSVSVVVGQHVVAGQVIGREGSSGSSSTGCHVHFAVVNMLGPWSWQQRYRKTLTGPLRWGVIHQRLNPAKFVPLGSPRPSPTPSPTPKPTPTASPPPSVETSPSPSVDPAATG